jgi:catechol 2,3-dioxygenase-like lactoylglutathione lyase family enzyme
MKKRIGEPWMPAPACSATLAGITLNLLVRDIEASVAFATGVLGATAIYKDPDFAALRNSAGEWCLHADHTYDGHPLSALLGEPGTRGRGAELRVHGYSPDAAEAAARARGDRVLAPATDKGHGLREVYILDPDGYTWVVDELARTA